MATRPKGEAPPRTLTERELNRALLARQLLLERSDLSIDQAVEQVGGLQTQYAPSGYVGLWTRLAQFERDDLTRALEDRIVIQATLIRTTIHIVSRREYWRYAEGIRRSRQEWAMRVRALPTERKLGSLGDKLRDALRDGPKTVKELDDLGEGLHRHPWPVGRPRPGSAVRHLGATPRRPARPGRGLGRAQRRDRGGGPRAPCPRVPAGIRARALEGHRVVGRSERRRR